MNPTAAPSASAVDQILGSPRAPALVAHLHAALAAEAERRAAFVDWLTEDDKAEFINGEVIVHSPAKARHNRASLNLAFLLRLYVAPRALGEVGMEKWLVSLTRNDYEPDVCFWPSSVAASFTPDQMRFPAPAFIAEVLSDATRGRDLGVKMEDYAAHGVTEYWVIDPEAATVAQYVVEGEAYELRLRAEAGVVASVAVPGFAVPVAALFDEAAFRAALFDEAAFRAALGGSR